MSMTETPAAPAPAKQKRKPGRKPPAKASTQPKAPAEFEGMTATDCCLACDVKKCVITGAGICGHPMKGGLQAPMMVRSDVVARYNRARKVLAQVKLDKLP